jgi:hypothetical protein
VNSAMSGMAAGQKKNRRRWNQHDGNKRIQEIWLRYSRLVWELGIELIDFAVSIEVGLVNT